MAAGLQSFQSNDKQMQAIRELTNELFNLKQKELTDMTALDSKINDQIAEVETKIPDLVIVKVTGGDYSNVEFSMSFDELTEHANQGKLIVLSNGGLLMNMVNKTSTKFQFFTYSLQQVGESYVDGFIYQITYNKTGDSPFTYTRAKFAFTQS